MTEPSPRSEPAPRPHEHRMRTHENEPIVVSRDVKAVLIPAGIEVKMKTGSVGYITQALGGSFTVYVEGNLFRIAGEDADAIGKEPPQKIELPPDATDQDVENMVWQQMRTCFDPEIPINIVDLGLIYSCDVTKRDDGTRHVAVRMTLTAPGCGMGEVLVQDVREKVELIPTITSTDVELVFDPPWSQDMMSEAARLQTGMM
jgi:probable FeS assembly SUF system protein SufT